jgi:hypothetical protein
VRVHLGIAVVNRLATQIAKPRPPPRMDFSEGILPGASHHGCCADDALEPRSDRGSAGRPECATWPTATSTFTSRLLTDFTDSTQEVQPGDEELVRLARKASKP